MSTLTQKQQLENIIDAIGQSIIDASDEEIAEDARLDGVDLTANADRLRAMFRKTLAEFEGANNAE